MSVSCLCSLAADLASNQLLRHALRLGEPVADTSLEYCGYTNRTVTSRLALTASCPCDHRRGVLVPAPKSLREVSLAELATAAGFNRDAGVVTFTLDGCDWARLGECRCPVPSAVERFIPAKQSHAGRCAKCRAPIRVSPFFRHHAVSAWTLGTAMDAPLATLGAGAVSSVLGDDGNRLVLFREPKV